MQPNQALPARPPWRATFLLPRFAYDLAYGDEIAVRLATRVDVAPALIDPEALPSQVRALEQTELLLGGWGTPRLDEALLQLLPKLQAVFIAAGSVRSIVTDAFWDRGLRICSSYAMNAIPVAEYSLGAILLSLKHAWRYAMAMKRERRYIPHEDVIGAFGATVGLVSLGATGRRLAQLLRAFDVRVLAYDPYVDPSVAAALGVKLVPLEALFAGSDVVSVHTPLTPGTAGMIGSAHFRAMRRDATFINTARGQIVREAELIAVLRERSDLTAVLDVTWPEPPLAGSPLFELPNVILTPHVAGSLGRECRRLGQCVADEVDRFVAGCPLQWEITRAAAQTMA